MEAYTRIGFVGSGNMAEAMCRCILEAELFAAEHIVASDIDEGRRERFRELGATAVEQNTQVLEQADIVVLALKPQHIFTVLEDLKAGFEERHLVISIAAGVTTESVEEFTGSVPVFAGTVQ